MMLRSQGPVILWLKQTPRGQPTRPIATYISMILFAVLIIILGQGRGGERNGAKTQAEQLVSLGWVLGSPWPASVDL